MANKVNIKLNNTNFYNVDTVRLPTVEGDVAEFSLGGSPTPPTPGEPKNLYLFNGYNSNYGNMFQDMSPYKFDNATLEDIVNLDSSLAQQISNLDYAHIYTKIGTFGSFDYGWTLYFTMDSTLYKIDGSTFMQFIEYDGDPTQPDFEQMTWFPNTVDGEVVNRVSTIATSYDYLLTTPDYTDTNNAYFPDVIAGAGDYMIVLVELTDGTFKFGAIKVSSIESPYGDYEEYTPPASPYAIVGSMNGWNNDDPNYCLIENESTGLYEKLNVEFNDENFDGFRGIRGASWDTIFQSFLEYDEDKQIYYVSGNVVYQNFPNNNDYISYLDKSSMIHDRNFDGNIIWAQNLSIVVNVYYNANDGMATIEYVSSSQR